MSPASSEKSIRYKSTHKLDANDITYAAVIAVRRGMLAARIFVSYLLVEVGGDARAAGSR
jgi:hypothetical protein